MSWLCEWCRSCRLWPGHCSKRSWTTPGCGCARRSCRPRYASTWLTRTGRRCHSPVWSRRKTWRPASRSACGYAAPPARSATTGFAKWRTWHWWRWWLTTPWTWWPTRRLLASTQDDASRCTPRSCDDDPWRTAGGAVGASNGSSFWGTWRPC